MSLFERQATRNRQIIRLKKQAGQAIIELRGIYGDQSCGAAITDYFGIGGGQIPDLKRTIRRIWGELKLLDPKCPDLSSEFI